MSVSISASRYQGVSPPPRFPECKRAAHLGPVTFDTEKGSRRQGTPDYISNANREKHLMRPLFSSSSSLFVTFKRKLSLYPVKHFDKTFDTKCFTEVLKDQGENKLIHSWKK